MSSAVRAIITSLAFDARYSTATRDAHLFGLRAVANLPIVYMSGDNSEHGYKEQGLQHDAPFTSFASNPEMVPFDGLQTLGAHPRESGKLGTRQMLTRARCGGPRTHLLSTQGSMSGEL
jgi:hypothetical protein